MSDSSNTFKNILPEIKNVYADKLAKAASKPNNKRYFNLIKKKLKENRPKK